jgi:hypothetical protein
MDAHVVIGLLSALALAWLAWKRPAAPAEVRVPVRIDDDDTR